MSPPRSKPHGGDGLTSVLFKPEISSDCDLCGKASLGSNPLSAFFFPPSSLPFCLCAANSHGNSDYNHLCSVISSFFFFEKKGERKNTLIHHDSGFSHCCLCARVCVCQGTEVSACVSGRYNVGFLGYKYQMCHYCEEGHITQRGGWLLWNQGVTRQSAERPCCLFKKNVWHSFSHPPDKNCIMCHWYVVVQLQRKSKIQGKFATGDENHQWFILGGVNPTEIEKNWTFVTWTGSNIIYFYFCHWYYTVTVNLLQVKCSQFPIDSTSCAA